MATGPPTRALDQLDDRALLVQRLILVGDAGDEPRAGLQASGRRAGRTSAGSSGGGISAAANGACMNSSGRSSGHARAERVGQRHQRRRVATSFPSARWFMSPRQRWTPKRAPSGERRARFATPRASSAAIAGCSGARHPRDRDQLDRDLDLEDHVVAAERVDGRDLGDGRVRERPATQQRALRPEHEERHVEVAGHADLERQPRHLHALARLEEQRERALELAHVAEVQAGALQPATAPLLEHRHLVVVRPVALLAQLEVGVVAQPLDDVDDPVMALAGLAVRERAQARPSTARA